MELVFEIRRANKCSAVDIDIFYELAKKAEQVNSTGLRERIENSHLLAFCRNNESLIGISAIKNPIEHYKKRIFLKAGIKNEANDYQFELGYCYTEEDFRGIQISFNLNKKLVAEIIDKKIYATTANPMMRRILEKIGFTAIGNPYKGEHNKDEIQIFGLKR